MFAGLRGLLGRRRFWAVAIALPLLALSWWRSTDPLRPSRTFSVTALSVPAASDAPPLAVTGLWEIEGSGAGFGGFSALIVMQEAELRAFSDRGWRITLPIPAEGSGPTILAQILPAPGYGLALFDVESATTSPRGEHYWLGYEATHAVHRFDADDGPGSVRVLKDEVNWPANGGIEAMAWLETGQMLAFVEALDRGYLFAGDPAEGAAMLSFPVTWPEADFRPTDAVQLPDGRVLVLMRRFSLDLLPRFESLLALGDVPQPDEMWRPEVFARLDQLVPPENYEGLAIRTLPDGDVELWLISDDNFSAFQRTLLVRLAMAGGG